MARMECPRCGYRMRRIYIKQSYNVKRGLIFKVLKRTSRLIEIGWWCPYCNYVEIEDIHPYEKLQIL